MNYIHVSFIRNVMNAESRCKGLSTSVLLKEDVSKNFRYCCVQPQWQPQGTMLVSGQGFRVSIIDSWGNTANWESERAAANLISEFCKHNTDSWKQSLHQKYYNYSYQEKDCVTYESACFCRKLSWAWEKVFTSTSYPQSPILAWSSCKACCFYFCMLSPVFYSFKFLPWCLPFLLHSFLAFLFLYQSLFSFS